MSDPFFRPWVHKENEVAAIQPPVEPHVNEQQQQQDQNELIIEPSGSQQRAPTEQATEEKGNRENKFVSNQSTQNTSNTPQPPTAHTSKPTSETLCETAATSAASASSVPLSLVTERQNLTSPLPSQRTTTHSEYTNSLPRPYTPKKKIVPTMSSALEAASVPVKTSETTRYSDTLAAPENDRALPKNRNIMNRNPLSFQQRFEISVNQGQQTPPQYMQSCVSVGVSTSAIAGQYVTTPTTSQSFTTTDGYHNCTVAQSQSCSQPAVASSLNQRTVGTSVLTETSQATNGHHLTTAPQVNSNSSTRPHTSASQSSYATVGQLSTPPTSQYSPTGEGSDTNSSSVHMNQASIQLSLPATKPVSETDEVENIWIDIETPESAVWSPLQKSPATSFCSETSQNTSEQHFTIPPPPPSESSSAVEGENTKSFIQSHTSERPNITAETFQLEPTAPAAIVLQSSQITNEHHSAASLFTQISTPVDGYDTNSLPLFHTSQTSKQSVPEKMEVEDESAMSSPLDQSASTSALSETTGAGYDSNSLSQASNQLSVTGKKTISGAISTEQMEIENENSWTDIESSDSDTSENTNGQHLTHLPLSQSSITVEANIAKSLPQPQSRQISERPSELAGMRIIKTDSTDSDIENTNPQENIQITDNREPKSPTPHTSKRPIKSEECSQLDRNSSAVVRTETTHGQHSPPRCSKTADNNNTSSLVEPQRRRSARQSTRYSTIQSTLESTKQPTKRAKKQSTQQPQSQSTGSPPPLIPSNGVSCLLIVPNKVQRTWSTLFYGMELSPLIRSIILATPPETRPILTMDQWQQGAKEYEDLTKNNTQEN